MVTRDNIGFGNLGKIPDKLNGGIYLLIAILSIHIAENKYQVGLLTADKICYLAVIFAEIFAVQIRDYGNFYISFDLRRIYCLFCQL